MKFGLPLPLDVVLVVIPNFTFAPTEDGFLGLSWSGSVGRGQQPPESGRRAS